METDDKTIEKLINNSGYGSINIYDRKIYEHFAYFREVFKKHGIQTPHYYAKVLSLGNIRFLLSSDFQPRQLYGYVNKAFTKYLEEAEQILLEKDGKEKELREKSAERFVQLLAA